MGSVREKVILELRNAGVAVNLYDIEAIEGNSNSFSIYLKSGRIISKTRYSNDKLINAFLSYANTTKTAEGSDGSIVGAPDNE